MNKLFYQFKAPSRDKKYLKIYLSATLFLASFGLAGCVSSGGPRPVDPEAPGRSQKAGASGLDYLLIHEREPSAGKSGK